MFYKKLRQILLEKGNWNIYIKSMENVNRNRKFKNKREYIYQVAQDLFMKIPNISENGHKKRLGYVLTEIFGPSSPNDILNISANIIYETI